VPATIRKQPQASRGEESCIRLTRLKLCEARGDIAAKGHHFAIRPRMQRLRGAARRTGTDQRPLRQGRETFRTEQDVALVRSRQNRTDGKGFRPDCLDILQRVHCRVDAPFGQPGIEFLGPQRLAADVGQRPILHLVAAGHHRQQVYRRRWPAMGRAQARARFLGLCHGQRGGARSKNDLRLFSHHRCLP
jgi:hypothetical protein